MNNRFYAKVALSNLKKNAKLYVPYLLTCILCVAMYYMIGSLASNPFMETMFGGSQMQALLCLGSYVVALFILIFLFYTNSFLIKRRKKEFGIFHILGMEKRHILYVLAYETVCCALLSLFIGIFFGIIFEQLIYQLIARLVQGVFMFDIYVSFDAIRSVILLFVIVYLLIYINDIRQIHLANPIDLLHGSNYGEREPKTKWMMTLMGIACLSGGYWIAVTVQDPLSAFLYFFLAVVLVILGTYLLFTAGSIAGLKLLKKNKRFYYRTTHFINVSTMIYRMKQNAVGLANICILSTMVLVMLSTTISLYIGMDDAVETQYPREFNITTNSITPIQQQELQSICHDTITDMGLRQLQTLDYSYLCFHALRQDNQFLTDTALGDYSNMEDISTLYFISLEEFNENATSKETLDSDEILLYVDQGSYDQHTLEIFDHTFQIKEQLDTFVGNVNMTSTITTTYYIVVEDAKILDELYAKQKEAYKDQASMFKHFYAFETDGTEKQNMELYQQLYDRIGGTDIDFYMESRTNAYSSFFSLYGGFLFIGIFLSILFVMAMILIMYYKQISEGYEDQSRFAIMQKVGLDQREVRHVIRSQVLMVFFLPLIVAAIHVVFAFPIIQQLLRLLYLTNTSLYILTTILCFTSFALIYCLFYLLTSKVYYAIIKQ